MGRKKKSTTENENAEIQNDSKAAENLQNFDSEQSESASNFAERIEATAENQSAPESESVDIEKLLEQYATPDENEKPKQKRSRKSKEEPKAQIIIPGRLFALLTDRVITSGIGGFDAFVSKRPIDPAAISLNEQQLDDIAPLAEECVKALKLENDPVTAFFGTIVLIHISNYAALKAMIMRESKKGNL